MYDRVDREIYQGQGLLEMFYHYFKLCFLLQIVIFLSSASSDFEIQAGPILESKDMGAVFQKKDKEMLKKEKILGNMGKNVQNLKIF